MTSESTRRALRRYAKKTKQYIIRLRKDTDADVIAMLDSVENRTGYIRQLVRRDVNGA